MESLMIKHFICVYEMLTFPLCRRKGENMEEAVVYFDRQLSVLL